MGARKTPFAVGEFYHVYNRGVDKRLIFEDWHDTERFFESMEKFNVVEPIGSLYELSFLESSQLGGLTPKSKLESNRLVNFISYCVNPNHFHFILEECIDGGISEFMKRLCGGYTSYFNKRHKRSGALFQGTFKSVHVNSNEYLLHLSAYVNLNARVHQLGGSTAKLGCASSWDQYIEKSNMLSVENKIFCKNAVVLEQFQNKNQYKEFAESSLEQILQKKESFKEIENLLLDE